MRPGSRSRLAALRGGLRRHAAALLATAGLALAAAWPVAPLVSPTGDPLPARYALHTPAGYATLAPLMTWWDHVAMLPMGRLEGFVAGLAVAFLAWRLGVRVARRLRWQRVVARELLVLLAALAALVTFIVAGLAWRQRPMVRLAGLDPDELAVEVHSHTNASHDVRGWLGEGYDAAASRAWHARAGVDVLFITDHNTTRGWEALRTQGGPTDPVVCPGIELSAHGAHVLVLGEPLPPSQAPYRGGPDARARLFAEVAATPGAMTIASLPEYRGQVAQFIAEGVQGFEVTSASPTGSEAARPERDSVVALARAHGLLLVGAGDQHGYGATPVVWNVTRLPGWRSAADPPCAAIVSRFRSGGPATVHVVERNRLRADSGLPWLLTPLGVAWLAWATAERSVLVGWLAWIWVASLAWQWGRRQLLRRREQAVRHLGAGSSSRDIS